MEIYIHLERNPHYITITTRDSNTSHKRMSSNVSIDRQRQAFDERAVRACTS
jgi:hypothetical protein